MNTYYLKAIDEDSLIEALQLAGYVGKDGVLQTDSKEHCIILRGVLYEPTGRMLTDEEGYEYPEMQPIDGYHADLYSSTLPVELESYQILPNTPQFTRA